MRNFADDFAELYIAGRFAQAGWTVFFPHRDKGFDLVVQKRIKEIDILAPVQVKGKFPTQGRSNSRMYGYRGNFTAFHPGMIVAIVYFSWDDPPTPRKTAYIPFSEIRKVRENLYSCEPGQLIKGIIEPRKRFEHLFDESGLSRLESILWQSQYAHKGMQTYRNPLI